MMMTQEYWKKLHVTNTLQLNVKGVFYTATRHCSFFSPWLVALPKLQKIVPYYSPKQKEEEKDSSLSQKYKHELKRNRPRPGFELESTVYIQRNLLMKRNAWIK